MRVAVAAFLLPLVLASPLATRSDQATLAPLESSGERIEDSYIVVFKRDVTPAQIAFHLSGVESWHGASPLYALADGEEVITGGIKHVYSPTADKFGYYGYEVAYVEHDQVVHTTEVPQGVDEPLEVTSSKDTAPGIVTALGSPWGLARISHREPLHLSTFQKYSYDPAGGEGVTAYVIDTGINIDHVEFEGRASWGKTIPQNDVDKDGNGHGTHCAGTVASRKYGVAKAAKVVAVKVLGSNGSGSMSDVVAGVVWAAEHAVAADKAAAQEVAKTGKTKHKGSVANMSLGGGKAKSLDDAVNAAVEAGLHFAVAAGNDNKDACNYSPAAAEKAVTVGASTLGDERAYFSNHGPCVDVFAPGLNIKSTWNTGNYSTNTISGTSMASPHIAGLLSYLLSIHGSETFTISENGQISEIQQASIYAKAYSLLPASAQALLPVPVELSIDAELRPIPKDEVLSPAKLKKALIALASPGLLSDLPSNTVNLLAFNNATIATK